MSVLDWDIKALLLAGAALRALLMVYSAFHDQYFRVKYTDVDYMIITDGAAAMAEGGSPFDRATFRYTPLLAVLMIPNTWLWLHAGKALFALCDLGAAYYCYRTLLTFATVRSAKIAVCAFILFNPIVVNVSTRGNSDMVVSCLSLAAISAFFEKKFVTAGAWLGFAIHFKLYPITYALPFVLGLAEAQGKPRVAFRAKLLEVLPLACGCGAAAAIAFGVPTVVCYVRYGHTYLYEALLYHFVREDHRHNLSPYWLPMYLNQGLRSLQLPGELNLGLLAFAPQLAVLSYVSYKLRRNVAHACCVQTVLFIAFNKVCTVQYFVWFLPFLPFIFYQPKAGAKPTSVLKAAAVVLLWSLTIPLWMFAAYQVEFRGKNDFVRLWLASCLFFLATVGLAAWLGRVALNFQRSAKRNVE